MALKIPETSTLHVFAQGAWDFLVASSALSVIVALIATAAEEYLRPRAQERLVKSWVRGSFKFKIDPAYDGPPPSWWLTFAEDGLNYFPDAFYALPADQLCAQIIRRVQSDIERYDGARGRSRPSPLKEPLAESDGWMSWGDQIEGYVDELQSTLTLAALRRSYRSALSGVVLLGFVLFGASAPYIDPRAARLVRAPDILQWALLTLVFGTVATLLSPIIQGAVTRLIRAR